MGLHPQDVLVLLKLAVAERRYSYAELARELGISSSQAHDAVRRCRIAGLVPSDSLEPNRTAVAEFLIHALKYLLPPRRGPVARGLPTAHSAPPLASGLVRSEMPVVWPDSQGEVRGESLEPIYKTAPMAARRDPRLYASLALVDAIRAGRARERKLGTEKLLELLGA